MTLPLGVTPTNGGAVFRVRSPHAQSVLLCLFDGVSEHQVPMERDGDIWVTEVPSVTADTRYGYRANGAWDPDAGLWFDPTKLLVDPYALELDRRFTYDPKLAECGKDTADIVPWAKIPPIFPEAPREPPVFTKGGLIYEINVRAFTWLHPDIPNEIRGTIAALAHPVIISHLRKLYISAIELMPITAWIDERHLPPLGLRNAWGYNPVTFMALDPGLAPGGVAELRETVAKLHEAGIGVILDLVFNHTGESDKLGPTLSLRGLDAACYATADDGVLINDTGTGNTLDFANPYVRSMALDAMRHFVSHCGIDGFRFDLAPVLARGPAFSPDAPIFAEIAGDPLLHDRVLIAEPWDIGPSGYRLGAFPQNWLEWNDRFRDDVRRFWRGDGHSGTLATRLAGSADIFGEGISRSVNFLAAHDGFTLADLTAYAHRHNEANGENNRDGHGESFSWNNGVEGETRDPVIRAHRTLDVCAMLATLFASTGTIMLTAGDEFGRTQHGNNNAYCQDNAMNWLDWANRDIDLEDYVALLAAWRSTRTGMLEQFPLDGHWLNLAGDPMTVDDWNDPLAQGFTYRSANDGTGYSVTINRLTREVTLSPQP